jgi:hypothetical protein
MRVNWGGFCCPPAFALEGFRAGALDALLLPPHKRSMQELVRKGAVNTCCGIIISG